MKRSIECSSRTRNLESAVRSLDRQDGRERILAVAIRSFAERGYEGTTTAGIARDAGVTQPLVHHHFGSKEGLWRAAMDALFANVPRVALVPADASLPERLMAVAEQVVRFVAANPELTRVMAREGAVPSPRLTYLIDRYLREPFRQVVDAVRAGQRAGLMAPDVRPDLLPFLVLDSKRRRAGSANAWNRYDRSPNARRPRRARPCPARTRPLSADGETSPDRRDPMSTQRSPRQERTWS